MGCKVTRNFTRVRKRIEQPFLRESGWRTAGVMEGKERGERKKRKNSIYDVVALTVRTGGICANASRRQTLFLSNVHVHTSIVFWILPIFSCLKNKMQTKDKKKKLYYRLYFLITDNYRNSTMILSTPNIIIKISKIPSWNPYFKILHTNYIVHKQNYLSLHLTTIPSCINIFIELPRRTIVSSRTIYDVRIDIHA